LRAAARVVVGRVDRVPARASRVVVRWRMVGLCCVGGRGRVFF
jgi:hypothetical protein